VWKLLPLLLLPLLLLLLLLLLRWLRCVLLGVTLWGVSRGTSLPRGTCLSQQLAPRELVEEVEEEGGVREQLQGKRDAPFWRVGGSPLAPLTCAPLPLLAPLFLPELLLLLLLVSLLQLLAFPAAVLPLEASLPFPALLRDGSRPPCFPVNAGAVDAEGKLAVEGAGGVSVRVEERRRRSALC